MDLPELSWQFLYARLAWALVLAALLAGLWPATRRLPRRALAGIGAACLLSTSLPGEASLAWHFVLAFQYPSGLLAGLCLVKLAARWNAAPAGAAALMPPGLAAPLALAGALLYLDAFGLVAGGYYYAGFGTGAALCALLLAAACALAMLRGVAAVQAGALLGALLLFSLARLPSGNLWDALLDPLLWGWALVSLCAAALRGLRGRAARTRMPAAGAESFSSIKE